MCAAILCMLRKQWEPRPHAVRDSTSYSCVKWTMKVPVRVQCCLCCNGCSAELVSYKIVFFIVQRVSATASADQKLKAVTVRLEKRLVHKELTRHTTTCLPYKNLHVHVRLCRCRFFMNQYTVRKIPRYSVLLRTFSRTDDVMKNKEKHKWTKNKHFTTRTKCLVHITIKTQAQPWDMHRKN